MASPCLWLAIAALCLLPAANAQGPGLDAGADDCQGPVDTECTHWVCRSDQPVGGCRLGCPYDEDCELVTCDLYVDTLFFGACFHE